MPQSVVPLHGGDIIESVITKGDLSKLTPQERVQYYKATCDSVGLNPLTRPLEYISLSGRLVLYARRDATDQLRKLHGISVEVVSQKVETDLLTVHVRAKDKAGRTDEDFGTVSVAGLRGEARANAQMKAITKAKRRVTLSIAGLGFLDETDVEDIPARERAAPTDTTTDLDQFAADTGEITSDTVPPPDRDILTEAHAAANDGTTAFRTFWRDLSPPERESIRAHIGDFERTAKTADKTDDDPFGLPPIPAELEVTEAPPPQFPRSAFWQEPTYRIAPAKLLLDGTTDWDTWAFDLTHLIGEATEVELDKLWADNKDSLNALRRNTGHSDRYRYLVTATSDRRADLKADAMG